MEEVKIDILKYMEERVEDQLNWYSVKATTNKRWYYGLLIAEIVLSALIPFATLYYETFNEIRYIIAMMGTAITIATGISSAFQYQKKWIEYRTTAETIKHVKFLYLSGISPYNRKNRDTVLIKNIESLISKENTNWSFYVQKSSVETEPENE